MMVTKMALLFWAGASGMRSFAVLQFLILEFFIPMVKFLEMAEASLPVPFPGILPLASKHAFQGLQIKRTYFCGQGIDRMVICLSLTFIKRVFCMYVRIRIKY